MAMTTLNNWRDSLLLGVAIYVKLINEDWDEFLFFDTIICTIKQVNSFLLYQLLVIFRLLLWA